MSNIPRQNNDQEERRPEHSVWAVHLNLNGLGAITVVEIATLDAPAIHLAARLLGRNSNPDRALLTARWARSTPWISRSWGELVRVNPLGGPTP